MFEGLKTEMEYGKMIGQKYGLRKGLHVYTEEHGFSSALGIVTALGVTLIGLYIIAIVVGNLGTQVSDGSIKLSSAWNTTLTNVDSGARSSFQIANILPIAVVGVGVMAIVIGAFSMQN
jgi:energy-converting hydrogenase Eha subunit A